MPAETESTQSSPDAIRVRAGDNTIHKFPAGTSDEVIDKVLKQYTQEHVGPAQPSLGQELWNYAKGSAEGLKQAATDIPKDAASFVGDFFKSLLPTRTGAEAGGRVVGKLGDVAQFATGGFGGPESPPAGRLPVSRTPAPLTAPQRTLRDFEKLGMTPSVPAITQRRPITPIFSPLRALPYSPIERGLQQNVQQAGQAAETVAGRFDPTANAVQAGRTAQEAVTAFAQDKQQAEADYGEFDRVMHGSKRQDMKNTITALGDLYKKFPSVPRLAEMFTNSKLGVMYEELKPRYQRAEPKSFGYGGDTVQIPGGTIRTRGWMEYPEIKELRTRVRYMMSDPGLRADIPQADLEKVRTALTKDLDQAAHTRGPEAVQALKRANDNYAKRQAITDRLEKIVDPANPEKAFEQLNAAAMQGSGRTDIGLLNAARAVMQPQQWQDIGAAVIRKLGYPTGREPIPGSVSPDFRLETFKANWDRLSPEAKDLLFGQQFPGTPRDTLETIARAGQNKALTFKGGSHLAGNPAMWLGVEAALRNLVHGGSIMPELTTLGGVYAISKGMMSPKFARWLYQQKMQKGFGAQVPIPGMQGRPYAGSLARTGAATMSSDTQRRREERMRESYNANRRGDLDEMRRIARRQSRSAQP